MLIGSSESRSSESQVLSSGSVKVLFSSASIWAMARFLQNKIALIFTELDLSNKPERNVGRIRVGDVEFAVHVQRTAAANRLKMA